jgi:hypothetical protein
LDSIVDYAKFPISKIQTRSVTIKDKVVYQISVENLHQTWLEKLTFAIFIKGQNLVKRTMNLYIRCNETQTWYTKQQIRKPCAKFNHYNLDSTFKKYFLKISNKASVLCNCQNSVPRDVLVDRAIGRLPTLQSPLSLPFFVFTADANIKSSRCLIFTFLAHYFSFIKCHLIPGPQPYAENSLNSKSWILCHTKRQILSFVQ